MRDFKPPFPPSPTRPPNHNATCIKFLLCVTEVTESMVVSTQVSPSLLQQLHPYPPRHVGGACRDPQDRWSIDCYSTTTVDMYINPLPLSPRACGDSLQHAAIIFSQHISDNASLFFVSRRSTSRNHRAPWQHVDICIIRTAP